MNPLSTPIVSLQHLKKTYLGLSTFLHLLKGDEVACFPLSTNTN